MIPYAINPPPTHTHTHNHSSAILFQNDCEFKIYIRSVWRVFSEYVGLTKVMTWLFNQFCFLYCLINAANLKFLG